MFACKISVSSPVDSSRRICSNSTTDALSSLSKNTISGSKKSKVNMTIRQKSTPNLGHHGSERLCGEENLKPQNLPTKQCGPVPRAIAVNEPQSIKKESLAINLELNSAHQRAYLDPWEEVQQWMTNSVPELVPLPEVSPCGLYSAVHRNDASVAPLARGAQGSLSVMRSVVSPISLQGSAFLSDPGRFSANCDDSCEPVLASGVEPPFGFPPDLAYGDMQSMGEQYHIPWSYPMPPDDNLVFSNHAFLRSTHVIEEAGLYPEWTSDSFQAGVDPFNGAVPCDSQQITWPPVPAVDSSAASSYSHNSLLGYFPNSPLSPDIQEEINTQGASLDEGMGIYPPLNIDEALPFSFPMDSADFRTGMRFVELLN